MSDALKTAAVIALPIVTAIATIGVIIGVAQTIVQVQDQNVAFAPKLVAVALIASVGGPTAFALVQSLLVSAIRALPALAHS